MIQRNNGRLFICQNNQGHLHPMHPDYTKPSTIHPPGSQTLIFDRARGQLMASLHMYPVLGSKKQLLGSEGGLNAFAASQVFDSSYFSTYYYPGSIDTLTKYEDRFLMLDKPVFNIHIRPRLCCRVHENNVN